MLAVPMVKVPHRTCWRLYCKRQGIKQVCTSSPTPKRTFRERIRINGQMISEQTVIDFVAEHRKDFDEISPSFFEMTVALAFDIFVREKVDIAVIEVGLGGRLDSTNIITPLVSVSHHQYWLGPHEYTG